MYCHPTWSPNVRIHNRNYHTRKTSKIPVQNSLPEFNLLTYWLIIFHSLSHLLITIFLWPLRCLTLLKGGPELIKTWFVFEWNLIVCGFDIACVVNQFTRLYWWRLYCWRLYCWLLTLTTELLIKQINHNFSAIYSVLIEEVYSS